MSSESFNSKIEEGESPEVVVVENKKKGFFHKAGHHSKNMGKKSLHSFHQLGTDFKNFINKGNVVDLAVGLVMGTAFTAVVNSFVTDIITPFISMASSSNLNNVFLVLRCPKDNVTHTHPPRSSCSGNNLPWATYTAAQTAGAITWNYGHFVNQVINFIIIAIIIFFIVKAYTASFRREKPVATKTCPFCATKIPISAIKCGFCTSLLPEVEKVEDPAESKGSLLDRLSRASKESLASKKKKKASAESSAAASDEESEKTVQKVPAAKS